MKKAFGAIVIDAFGRVLIREPSNHFDGMVWTFPKGRQDPGETPEQVALRETLEETGWRVELLQLLKFDGIGGTSITRYFLAKPVQDTGKWDHETAAVRWVTRDEAKILLSYSTNPIARTRDLAVLEVAFATWRHRNMQAPQGNPAASRLPAASPSRLPNEGFRGTRAGGKSAERRYESSHWGIAPRFKYNVNDPDLPKQLTEMGKLMELQVRVGARGEVIPFLGDAEFYALKAAHEADRAHRVVSMLAFDVKSSERLYLVLTPTDQARCARELWAPMPKDPLAPAKERPEVYDLGDVAHECGGRQARFPYPRIDVQVLGKCSHVVYCCEKEGDGYSPYEHKLGEDGGTEPFLCVSRDGRLWFAGGSYTVPDEGITR